MHVRHKYTNIHIIIYGIRNIVLRLLGRSLCAETKKKTIKKTGQKGRGGTAIAQFQTEGVRTQTLVSRTAREYYIPNE